MKNFLFLYRADYNRMSQASPDEMQANMQKWMDWVGGLAAQNKLVERGSSLEASGKMVKDNTVITDGPFADIKEAIMGYSIVKAGSLDEAAALADGCPILPHGTVEVREIRLM